MSETTGLCVWQQNEEGQFETECGNVFELNSGMPSENDMRFCCYCGGALVERGYSPLNANEGESP